MNPQPFVGRRLGLVGVVVLALLTSAAHAQSPAAGLLPAGQEHRWMDELFRQRPAAINQSLAEFIFPGSHDSGTYDLTTLAACEGCRNTELITDTVATCKEKLPGTALDHVCDALGVEAADLAIRPWAKAQDRTIGAQLAAGNRYLDLRFFRATMDDAARTNGAQVAGTYYAHHTLAGSTSTEIFDDIATFLDDPAHRREVVIIEFSQMQEGPGDMSPQGVADLFAHLRSRLGSRMAPETISHTMSIHDFLASGYQAIVTCSCDTPDADVGSSLSTYGPDGLGAADGYPPADDAEAPWRNDDEVQELVETISSLRGSRDEMFGMYLAIGFDNDGSNLIRGLACGVDPLNASGYCDAVNDDWDQIDGLLALADWLNPKAIPALVSLPRDRVNIVVVDRFGPEITQEIFKLNFGATRVRFRIDRVIEGPNPPLDRLDFDSAPDYYPSFWFPDSTPTRWTPQMQRYNTRQDDDDLMPFWPAWKSYPNSRPAALAGFALADADSAAGGGDDYSTIWPPPPPPAPIPPDWRPDLFLTSLPIAGCVANSAECQPFDIQRRISGGGAASASEVRFRYSTCVWSWLPGDVVDPASLCDAPGTPQLTVYSTAGLEGDSAVRSVEFAIELSEPVTSPVTVEVSSRDGTASAGSDYEAVVGKVIIFRPGQTRTTGVVRVSGDRDFEADETLSVVLSNATGATIAEGTATLTILNDDGLAAPTLVAPGPQSGAEGSSLTLALGRLTAGDSTGPWLVDVDWGDGERGSFDATAPGALSGAHIYADNGAYTVRVAARSAADVWSSVVSFVATIANVSPTAVLQNNGPVDEGAAVTITFANQIDPSTTDAAAGYRYAVSCTNGSLAAATYATSAPAPLATCTFADAGTYTVRGVILDKDNGATEYTTVVTVREVAPTVTGLTAQSGHEGAPLVFSLGTLVDAASDGPWSVAVTWGDNAAEIFTAAAPGLLARSHTYADNGVYTVTVTVRDANGVSAAPGSAIATIANVAPVVTAAGSTIDEGGVATVSGIIVDPGVRDSFVVTVTWGDGTSTPHSLPAGAASYSVSHQYLDDAPTGTPSDVTPVMAAVVDKDGGSGAAATAVTVRNVAPQVQALSFADELGTPLGPAFLALSGLPVDLAAVFSDLGTLDTHQATIAWGDGTSSASAASAGVVRARHTWGAVGTFNVTLTLSDDDTGVGTRQATVTVTSAKGAICGLGQLLTTSPGGPKMTTMAASLSNKRPAPRPEDKVIEAIDLACQMFTKRLDVVGVAMVERAVWLIEGVIANGGLEPARLAIFRQVEARLVLAAKWAYVSAARETTHPLRRAWAAAVAAQADAAMVDQDWVRAVRHWLAALVVLVL